MQLNNIENGRIAKISDIDFKQNRVIYSIYESLVYDTEGNIILAPLVGSFRFNPKIKLESLLDTTFNPTEYCYQKLQEEILLDYEISEDIQNWAIETGSTGELTTIRVYIPAAILNEVLNTGEPLDLLIQDMKPLSPFAQRKEFGSMQYLENLLPEHREILETYPTIKIEEKI